MNDGIIRDVLRGMFPESYIGVSDTDAVREIYVNIAVSLGKEDLRRITALEAVTGYSVYLAPSDGFMKLVFFRLK